MFDILLHQVLFLDTLCLSTPHVYFVFHRRTGNSKTNDKSSVLLPSEVQRAISSRPVLVTKQERSRSILASAQPGKHGRGTLTTQSSHLDFSIANISYLSGYTDVVLKISEYDS